MNELCSCSPAFEEQQTAPLFLPFLGLTTLTNQAKEHVRISHRVNEVGISQRRLLQLSFCSSSAMPLSDVLFHSSSDESVKEAIVSSRPGRSQFCWRVGEFLAMISLC